MRGLGSLEKAGTRCYGEHGWKSIVKICVDDCQVALRDLVKLENVFLWMILCPQTIHGSPKARAGKARGVIFQGWVLGYTSEVLKVKTGVAERGRSNRRA